MRAIKVLFISLLQSPYQLTPLNHTFTKLGEYGTGREQLYSGAPSSRQSLDISPSQRAILEGVGLYSQPFTSRLSLIAVIMHY